MDTLTVLQERFAAAYAQHGNATKAAIEAGYSEGGASSQGCALLRIPKVRAAIEANLKDSAPIITRDVLARELWRTYQTCHPREAEIPVIAKGQIVGYKLGIIGDASASNRALELLAKIGGMMVEKSEVTVTVEQAAGVIEREIAVLEERLRENDPIDA